MAKRIAVIGLAFRFPNTTTQTYWADLLAGCDLVSEVDAQRWALDAYLHPDKKHPGTAYTRAAGSIGDVSGFDAAFFGISPREAGLMDPQQRVLLELAWEAIEHAGMQPARLRGSDCGVYVGIASTDYAYRIADDMDSVDAPMPTGNTPSIAANRLSFFYGLHGPSMALDTACSSSMVAFHQACRAIAAGECVQALAGGISLHLHPYGFIGFSKTSMLSPRGRCRVFDASADGYVRSEGGGLFLLKDYDRALADGDPILAVVAGTAVNTDGRKSGLTIPCADAQAALMRRAYADAGIAPGEIDYLEAHGTGTPVGDPIEARAIGMALGQPRGAGQPLPIGSVKSNMGHLETASGVAGLVKAIYALRHRVVPATIGVETINPNINPDEWNIDIVTANRPLRAEGRLVVGVNSFGFGGANAHVILESAPEVEVDTEPTPAPDAALPLVLTGKTPQAVRDVAARLADALSGQHQSLYDAAYQLAHRRQWHDERALVFAASLDEAKTRLREFAAGDTPAHGLAAGSVIAEIQSDPVFVYSGNGSQWAGMGRKLLDDPVFSATMAEIDDMFQPLAGYSLVDELRGENGENRYDATEFAQPALFAVQVGITRMLARLGVAPAAVIGHSVGEVAAAWACGALSLAEAVQVIYHRSRLQGLTRGSGEMTAVGLSGEDARALLAALGLAETLHVAGFNSGRGATVAGAPATLAVLEAHLSEQQVFCRRLNLDYAFHSPAMDVIETEVRQSLAGIAPRASEMPFYSTVTGAALDGAQLDADYWWRNIRVPVQFVSAVSATIADDARVFVEIGPHAVLRAYLHDALKDADTLGRVITTASRDGDEPERITAAAGQVIASGARIDWDVLFPHCGQHVELPAYPWQRERHWHPVSPESQGLLAREIVHPLLGYALAQHENTWQQSLDTQSHPLLADHVVGDAVVFPGAGYAELALAAAWEWKGQWQGEGHRAIEIEELDIHAPLLLAHAPSKIVRTVLMVADGRLTIKAKEHGADTGWTPYASARVLPAPGTALLGGPALALPATPPDFSADDHKAFTNAVGLNYGPAFCAIAEGWHVAADTVLARFAPHARVAAELPRMHLHPALLDGAFQLIVHLLKDDLAMGGGIAGSIAGSIAFVPVKIGRLAVRVGGGPPQHVRVQLRRRSPRSLTVDVTLYDADGAVLAAARDVRFRGVRLRKAAHEHLDFLDIIATPRPLPHPVPPAVLDAAALRQHLIDSMRADEASTRFSHEVEPLLEALCDRSALDALTALAADDGTLTATTVHDLAARAPGSAALLQHLLQRAVAAGDAQAVEHGWTLGRPDAASASAADIWNTLLREYPDVFPAIHALGRIGLHLPALLSGQAAADDICPRALTPAAIDALALGPALARQLGQSVTTALVDAQTRLPAGQRLSVLEAGGAAPLFVTACAHALDINLADVHYATPDAALAEQVARQFRERHLPASVDLITDTTDADAHHDLIIVHAAFATLADADQALAHARARLKPGGVLLLLARAPAPWRDMLFGARSGWWHEADGQWHSIQPSAQDWQARLQALGLTCDEVLAAKSGAYALIARLPVIESTPADLPATPSRAIVLLADADGAANDFAHALQTRLLEVGHRCALVQDLARGLALDVTQTEHLDALLDAARQQLGRVDDIVHLDGWGAANMHMSADALTQAQVHRCALAAGLMQACARTNTDATLWLVTSGMMQTMRPEAPAAGLPALNDTALWGYGRTLMNEAVSHRVRLLDIPAETTPALLTAITRELAANDLEDEILLTATGARFAPRLRERPRPVPPPFAPSSAAHHTPANTSIRLGFEFPGQLRNLRWETVTLPPPAENQLLVRVHATGLNFRDVMYALGMLSDEAVENGFVGPSLGLEFAGIVTEVGANVTDYQPGDAVVGFGPASFSTLTLTTTDAIARIPEGFSFEAAATLPSAFFTVYYALTHLARLQAGEKILIHGAAGGVGIAAVQLAQACGAQVYATAGSIDKRDFLRLMGVQHIYDSRALGYADDILADTQGAGVDVVLNSLAGEAINRNFRVLKPFGRFLELGKRDFYENTHIGLRPFRNNISYFGIDADQLMRERPDLTRRLFGELMDLFALGQLHPLPWTEFDAGEVVHAFRHMQQAQQIGKIVVTYQGGIKDAAPSPAPSGHPLPLAGEGTALPSPIYGRGVGGEGALALHLPADASYLVTGGLGGFGLRTAQWLAEKGARHLILIGRSGVNDDNATAIADLRAQGVTVHAAACDVTDRAALAALLDATATTLPPLKGIIHAAAVIEDALAVNATRAQIERNFAAKVLGARHLHELTLATPLDFCVYYSSATTLFGNPGQSAYIAANTWLEALAAQRRAQGLPATCVRWGPIDDVGFLARNARIKHALQDRMGGAALASNVALAALEDMLLANASGLAVLELDWRALARFLPRADAPKFAELARHVEDDTGIHDGADDIAQVLATLDDAALHAHLIDMLKAELGDILRIHAAKIDPARSIYDMGLDSLMGVELVVALENRLGLKLPVMALNESPTLDKLAQRLLKLLRDDGAAAGDADDAITATVTHIAASHAADVSGASIENFVTDFKNSHTTAPPRLIQ